MAPTIINVNAAVDGAAIAAIVAGASVATIDHGAALTTSFVTVVVITTTRLAATVCGQRG